MTSEAFGQALACGLVAVFAASAFAKAAYWDDTHEWFSELFSKLPAAVVAAAVVCGEVVIVAGIVVAPQVGGAAAVLWLLAASAVLWSARRRVASCGCFGLRQRLGVGVVIRNTAALMVAGGTTLLAGPGLQLMVEIGLVGALVGISAVVIRETINRRGVLV